MPAARITMLLGAALCLACAPRGNPQRPVTVILVEVERFALSGAPKAGEQTLELRDVAGESHLLQVAGREVALAPHSSYLLDLDLAAGDHELLCTTHATRRTLSVTAER
jgi:hypothetical protein